VLRRLERVEGIELAAWRHDGEARVRSEAGELRFSPGSEAIDRRGRSWDLEGSPEALELELSAGELRFGSYPDALGRLWDALAAGSTGDVLLSARPGYEFVDWGGADHAGGGSHGSLREEDSMVPLVFWACGPDAREQGAEDGRQWSITDVASEVLDHFGAGAQSE
jgi:hypothetical protein